MRTEVVAGLTTFLTMAYIIFVNPNILSAAGMDQGAVFVATCVAAAIGCLIMALLANWPVAMAPGMGLNAFFAFTVVGAMGFTWQQALGAVFISGIIFLILTVTGIRRWLIEGIPTSMRSAIAAGIGLFLGIIALQGSGIVVDNPATKYDWKGRTTPGLPNSTKLKHYGFSSTIATDITDALTLKVITSYRNLKTDRVPSDWFARPASQFCAT